ncbi:MAG: hypothetical protein HY744_07300 [Deltaproteobacteria bacterium]|nr:hypothetical protein [Deltaproteobacteria bacterium]
MVMTEPQSAPPPLAAPPALAVRARTALRVLLVLVAAAVWWVLYRSLEPTAKWLTYRVLSMTAGSHLAAAVEFFIYEAPKVLMLLVVVVLGVVSAPCAAPILVVLLTYLAGSGSSVPYGGLLLLVYALGHSVLILLAGTSMGAARALIENRKATRALGILRRAAGALVVLVGAYFAYRGLA